ncbi:hypothetical protein JB92DRAFT_3104189 [Gautieria morchelliformis]|nr:hypothetical protein JB92DRAFT_3104189 [Gautieria morchelliformis]
MRSWNGEIDVSGQQDSGMPNSNPLTSTVNPATTTIASDNFFVEISSSEVAEDTLNPGLRHRGHHTAATVSIVTNQTTHTPPRVPSTPETTRVRVRGAATTPFEDKENQLSVGHGLRDGSKDTHISTNDASSTTQMAPSHGIRIVAYHGAAQYPACELHTSTTPHKAEAIEKHRAEEFEARHRGTQKVFPQTICPIHTTPQSIWVQHGWLTTADGLYAVGMV